MNKKYNYCIDCSKEIDFRAKRCVLCSRKWQVGKNNGNYKHGNACKDKKHYCLDCGKEINWQSKRCYSCSQKVRFLSLEERKKCSVPRYGKDNPMFGVHRFGDKSPTWIDGCSFEPYTVEFNKELKEKIRKRDNYKCQNCSMNEEEHIIVIGTVLNVHHIDYNK